MTRFAEDPPTERPQPDKESLALAHNHMIHNETPIQRYIRQQWDVTFGAMRVAMDAWRRIYPAETSYEFSEYQQRVVEAIARDIEQTIVNLDSLSSSVRGDIMHEAENHFLPPEQIQKDIAEWDAAT